jgi:hypothetical protein
MVREQQEMLLARTSEAVVAANAAAPAPAMLQLQLLVVVVLPPHLLSHRVIVTSADRCLLPVTPISSPPSLLLRAARALVLLRTRMEPVGPPLHAKPLALAAVAAKVVKVAVVVALFRWTLRAVTSSSQVTRRFARREKRHFLRHLYIKTNILPRQARDKHRKRDEKKRGVFCRTPPAAQRSAQTPP